MNGVHPWTCVDKDKAAAAGPQAEYRPCEGGFWDPGATAASEWTTDSSEWTVDSRQGPVAALGSTGNPEEWVSDSREWMTRSREQTADSEAGMGQSDPKCSRRPARSIAVASGPVAESERRT